MTELLTWDWSEIIQSTTGLITVCIAGVALNSWRGRHKAEKVTVFLDELSDAIHEYVQLMSVPIQYLQFIKIRIDSHQYDRDLNNDLDFPEAVAFIEKDGKEEAARLLEALNPCTKSFTKIRSLEIKGQAFNINNYSDCQNACKMITWQYDRLLAV